MRPNVTISESDRVGEIADRLPYAARVFEVVGIDYCCHRDRSLRDAAAAAKMEAGEITDLLLRTSPIPARQAPDPEHATLRDLTGYIVGHHHKRTRRMLVELTLLAGQAVSAHGSRSDDARDLQDHITRLSRELIPHMRNEEQYLFPYIDSLEREIGPDETIVVPLFGTVTYPLQKIHHDHAVDLALLASLREITRNFTPPQRACDRVRELYRLLEDFEDDLKKHVAIENDVLFLRAVDEEKQAVERARKS